jgi:hypothetical protein
MTESDNTLKQIIVGIIILVTATTILAATGWNFSQVSKMPEKYVLKDSMHNLMKENRDDHIRITEELYHIRDLLIEHHTHDLTEYEERGRGR